MRAHLKDPVLLIFFAIAGLFLAGSVALGWRQHQQNAWPRVSVTVVSSEVVKNQHGRYQGQVKVKTTDGQEVVVEVGSAGSDPAAAQQTIDLVSRDQRLIQNPADHHDLRLPPQTIDGWLPWILATGGLLFALIPIAVIGLSQRADAFRLGGFVFVAIGALLLGISAFQGWTKVQVLRTWPMVEASVIESSVGYRPGKTRPLRGIDLLVTYEAEGTSLTTLVGSQTGSADLAYVESQIATTYAPGSKLSIRYQPGHPRSATFEADWSLGYFWEVLLMASLGSLMALLGLAMAKYLGRV